MKKDSAHVWAGENVFGVLPARKANLDFVFGAEVIETSIRVVDERTADVAGGILVIEKRDAHVVRVELGRCVVGAWVALVVLLGELTRGRWVQNVGVPKREVAAAAIEATGLFAKAIDRVVLADTSANHERVVLVPIGPSAVFVAHRLKNRASVGAVNINGKRFVG